MTGSTPIRRLMLNLRRVRVLEVAEFHGASIGLADWLVMAQLVGGHTALRQMQKENPWKFKTERTGR